MKKYIKFLWPVGWFRSPKQVVAVLPLCGVIGKEVGLKKGLTLQALEKQIEKAFLLPNLKAVALAINSPGGSPVQSELIYKYIRKQATDKNVPVYSFVEDVAASGGYWLACSGDKIFASRASIVGSIGVIASGFGFQHAIKKLGIERRIYKQGANKSILDPFMKERPEDVKIVMKAQANIHRFFKDLVRERRGKAIKGQDEDLLFSGEFWTGEDAKALGLIDDIGDMYSVLEAKFGKKVKMVRLEKPTGFFKKFGISAERLAHDMCDVVEERVMWGRYR